MATAPALFEVGFSHLRFLSASSGFETKQKGLEAASRYNNRINF